MPRSSRDEEFSAFVQTRRTGLVRSACLLTAGDTHLAEDLAGTAPSWPSSPAARRYWSSRSRGAAEPASPA